MPRGSSNADHEVESALVREAGRRLTAARLEARLTQGQLGAAIGVTNVQIGSYERGLSALPLARAVLLARAMEIDVVTLLPTECPGPEIERRRVEDYPELVELHRQLDEADRKKVLNFIRRLLFRRGGANHADRVAATSDAQEFAQIGQTR